jgi:hypothetical protein
MAAYGSMAGYGETAEVGADGSGDPNGAGIFQGQSVVAYAAEAGISIHTARWYVKHIYAKAGVHKQTELIYQLLKRRAGGAESESGE